MPHHSREVHEAHQGPGPQLQDPEEANREVCQDWTEQGEQERHIQDVVGHAAGCRQDGI